MTSSITMHPAALHAMSDLVQYFERYALLSCEKQARLFPFLGEHSLELDLDAGMARFSERRSYPFQVLGTESEHSLTWLWAWADEHAEVPEALLAAARTMKIWGEERGVPELALPSLDLDRADGTQLSLIASEVCGASGFYRDHYEGGNLFLLLSGIALDDRQSFDRQGLARQLGDLASRYDFDHRNALVSYLHAKDIRCSLSGTIVSAELASGERIIAEFDDSGRIRAMNGDGLP
jgi:hypothetical protein